MRNRETMFGATSVFVHASVNQSRLPETNNDCKDDTSVSTKGISTSIAVTVSTFDSSLHTTSKKITNGLRIMTDGIADDSTSCEYNDNNKEFEASDSCPADTGDCSYPGLISLSMSSSIALDDSNEYDTGAVLSTINTNESDTVNINYPKREEQLSQKHSYQLSVTDLSPNNSTRIPQEFLDHPLTQSKQNFQDIKSIQSTSRSVQQDSRNELYSNVGTKGQGVSDVDSLQLWCLDDKHSTPSVVDPPVTEAISQSTNALAAISSNKSASFAQERKRYFSWWQKQHDSKEPSNQQTSNYPIPDLSQGACPIENGGADLFGPSRDRTLSEPGNIQDLLCDDINLINYEGSTTFNDVDIEPLRTDLRRRRAVQKQHQGQANDEYVSTSITPQGNCIPVAHSNGKYIRRRRAVTTGAEILRNYCVQSASNPRDLIETKHDNLFRENVSNEGDEQFARIATVPLSRTTLPHDVRSLSIETIPSLESQSEEQPLIQVVYQMPATPSTPLDGDRANSTPIRYRRRNDGFIDDSINRSERWHTEINRFTSEQPPNDTDFVSNSTSITITRDNVQSTIEGDGDSHENDDNAVGNNSVTNDSPTYPSNGNGGGNEGGEENNSVTMNERGTNTPTRADSERWARHRWMQINRRFQLVIALVALLFSLLLFAILIAWVVLTSAYVVSLSKECDVQLRKYYWFVTLQLLLDVFRTDIMRFVFQWDSNSGQRIPTRVIVYNIMYLFYAFLVLRLGISSCFEYTESTCRQTAPFFFHASAVFVSLSIGAWVTIICGYLIPFCVVACLLTFNGYNPSSLGGANDPGRNISGQAVFPTANGAPPDCIDRLPLITLSSFPSHYPKECCICMEDFHEDDVLVHTSCLHVFHKTCCKEWLQQSRTCPICRDDIAAANGYAAEPTGIDTILDGTEVGAARTPLPSPPTIPMIPIGPTPSRPAVAGLIRMIQQNVNNGGTVPNVSGGGRATDAATVAGNASASTLHHASSTLLPLPMDSDSSPTTEMTITNTASIVHGSTSISEEDFNNRNDVQDFTVASNELQSETAGLVRDTNLISQVTSSGNDVERGVTI